MIQRVQSLFLFIAGVSAILIVFYAPVLEEDRELLLLKDNFQYARFFILFSSILSIYSIFQFRNRKRQLLLTSITRLFLTVGLIILLFVIYREDKMRFSEGFWFFLIPYFNLFLAQFFIKSDEKKIRSADRIR